MMRTIQLAVACVAVLVATAGKGQAGVIINEINLGDDDYIELFNFDANFSVNISGYVFNIRDSGFGSFDLTLPSIVLAPNSGIAVIGENPQPGEIDAGQNIPWLYTRNLSLTLRDAGGDVIDFWAHGASLFGAPAGVTFSPSPLQLINTDTNATTYQRIAVTSSGLAFFGSDWTTDSASRGQLNTNQVFASASAPVPEPSSLAIFGIGACVVGIGVARRRRAEQQQEALV